MEDLTKHQIILLCLLLSFVTSIGTGVITFSLLSEAPLAVTQTINRVVEKTIERVVPVESQANVNQVTVKETVVVQEEDLIIDAVEKNAKKVVRIRGVRTPEADSSFYGIGVIVRKDGLIVAPADIVEDGVLYSAQFEDGKIIPFSGLIISDDKRFVFFKPSVDIKDLTFSSVSFAEASHVKLGQSSVAISGENTHVVTLARISALGKSTGTTTNEFSYPFQTIEIDTTPRDSAPGEALFNLAGEYLGMSLSRGLAHVFVPAFVIQKNLEILEKTLK